MTCFNFIFYCEGHQTLEEVVQKGYEFSIISDIKNVTGHSPEELAQVNPAFCWGVELDDLQKSLTISMIV